MSEALQIISTVAAIAAPFGGPIGGPILAIVSIASGIAPGALPVKPTASDRPALLSTTALSRPDA